VIPAEVVGDTCTTLGITVGADALVLALWQELVGPGRIHPCSCTATAETRVAFGFLIGEGARLGCNGEDFGVRRKREAVPA
jgi:hypothetical protein